VLRKGLLSGNLQLHAETRATKLLKMGTTIIGVEAIDPSGRKLMFTADSYILAASPIEDVRLLLLSDPGGPGLGNSSGLLGRNVMFHFQTLCIGVFTERMHAYRGKAVSHGMTDFRGKPGDAMHPLAGIVEFGGAEPVLTQSLDSLQILGLGAQLKQFVRQGSMGDRLLGMTMQAEDAPQTTNRVDLDPGIRDVDGLPVARVTYSNHDFELSARDFYSPKLMDIMAKAGAKYVFVPPADSIPASRHVMGTMRFGSDPKTSVCNPSGRLHDLDNLYVADGALFPTSAGFNPSLTIATLAAYVASDILSPGSPTKVIS
jgi:gluconate 2-dehydrogenase alpha chain